MKHVFIMNRRQAKTACLKLYSQDKRIFCGQSGDYVIHVTSAPKDAIRFAQLYAKQGERYVYTHAAVTEPSWRY